LRARAVRVSGIVLPPVLMLALLGVAWELLCSAPDATLPPPS
jgi:nitrate/nitrite transport system permease protein